MRVYIARYDCLGESDERITAKCPDGSCTVTRKERMDTPVSLGGFARYDCLGGSDGWLYL